MPLLVNPTSLKPPPRWRLLFESQALVEYARLRLQYRSLIAKPAAFEYPFILFPGLGTSERALSYLAVYLKDIGGEVFDWGIGKNHGYAPDLIARMKERLTHLVAQRRTKFNLLGWSLGGIVAREVARDLPESVAKIATLGTPVVGGAKYTAAARLYQKWGFDLDAIERDTILRSQQPIQNEIIAIYSHSDNVIAWQACIDRLSPHVSHKVVNGSHWGLVVNAQAYLLLREFFAVQDL